MTPIEWAILFVAGIGGSAHCLGMCGVFAIGAGRNGMAHFLSYTFGRLSAYFTIGLLAGMIGQPLRGLAFLGGVQVAVSISFGVAMFLAGLHLLGMVRLPVPRLGTHPDNLLVRILRATLPPAGPAQALYLGVGNGLLPCPLIYGFVAVAMSAGSSVQGGLAMAAFGLGTVPALLGAAMLARATRAAAAPSFSLGKLRLAPGIALLVLGVLTAGRAALIFTGGTHGAHVAM